MNLTRHIHNDSSIGVWLTVKSTMEEILKYLSIIEDYDTADLLKVVHSCWAVWYKGFVRYR